MPDMLLMYIFQYFRASDLIVVSQTCKKFMRLSEDRILVRKCDFSDSFYSKENDICDYVKVRGCYITVLNLNNCFWIREKTASAIVKKCPNVVELHMLQCKLSLNTVAAAVRRGKLRKLSWSYQLMARGHMKRADQLAVKPCSWAGLASLRALTIDVCEPMLQKQQQFISSFLERCRNLETLAIYMSKLAQLPGSDKFCESRLDIATCWLYNFLFSDLDILRKLPTMRSLSLPICVNSMHHDISVTVDKLRAVPASLETLLAPVTLARGQELEPGVDKLARMRHVVLKVKSLPQLVGEQQWEYVNAYSADTNADLSQGLDAFLGAAPRLRQLKLQNYAPLTSLDFLDRCRDLTHLSLSNTHVHSDTNACAAIALCPRLRHLALPVCALVTTRDERLTARVKRPAAGGGGARKRRVGMRTRPPADADDTSNLRTVVDGCPDVCEFELIAPGCSDRFTSHEIIDQTACKFIRYVGDDDIAAIGRWTRLERLTLVRLKGLTHGSSLVDIAHRCTRLRSLTLVYVGGDNGNARCELALREALTHLPRLRDLRLEQPRVAFNPQFLSALARCTCLRRLAVVSLAGSLDGASLATVLDAAPLLTYLQVSANVSVAEARGVQRDLMKRYLCGRRPSLVVSISPCPRAGSDAVFEFALPFKHFSEMSCWKSRICGEPDNEA
ncbi:PREDICTED: F-box/LRR-repeat protein 18-like [Priapulus caudatus]|uniref:F-box/LRR-repeat protein 18-like n=1 Tax=Priapulus caudatus TaxID=37621 RepID=A0ABM1DNQ8_PRICU|nr:PREDICTED: F-box/LRR-repeat protein 18-like [Priapulus caudatus]